MGAYVGTLLLLVAILVSAGMQAKALYHDYEYGRLLWFPCVMLAVFLLAALMLMRHAYALRQKLKAQAAGAPTTTKEKKP